MKLVPFGALHQDYQASLAGLFTPMKRWPSAEQAYRTFLQTWLDDVASNIWPSWQGGQWVGAAAAKIEAETKAELDLAVELYHGGGNALGALEEVPKTPVPADGKPRTHEWHYKIEDALVLDAKFLFIPPSGGQTPSFDFQASKNIGSNYLAYDPRYDITRFETLFWDGVQNRQPSIWNIKQHFQRPRPWMTATGLGVDGFRWIVAGGPFVTHTGIHPSLLSGHCIQGILGGCSFYQALLDEGIATDDERLRVIRQYMVDWGDRRVFAGVHYMTDNIASWTLARRLIPHLFQDSQQVEEFAVQAITGHSRVFADIVKHFDAGSAARRMLLDDFPEADATN